MHRKNAEQEIRELISQIRGALENSRSAFEAQCKVDDALRAGYVIEEPRVTFFPELDYVSAVVRLESPERRKLWVVARRKEEVTCGHKEEPAPSEEETL